MRLRVLYFARLAEQLGRREENVELAMAQASIADLRAHLAARGGVWAEVMQDARRTLTAVNHGIARNDTPLGDGDEVAFFPPVTGG